MTLSLQQLMRQFPATGRLRWIGSRPERGAEMIELQQVMAITDSKLEGDRFSGRPGSKRQVTLIQQEHLAVIGQCLGRPAPIPADLRRNLVISGINLLALPAGIEGAAIPRRRSYSGNQRAGPPLLEDGTDTWPGWLQRDAWSWRHTARIVRGGSLQVADPITVIAPE